MPLDHRPPTTSAGSSSAPPAKLIRSLRQRRGRDETGLFLVEGIAHVLTALETGAAVEHLCYAPDLLTSAAGERGIAQAQAAGVPCHRLGAAAFESLSERDHPVGILALVRQRWTPLADLDAKRQPWLVALQAPQDPGNVGTVLRTIDAVGASGLVLLDGGADPFHPGAVRASMGALFHLPVAKADSGEFLAWASGTGHRLVGTSAKASGGHRDLAFPLPLVLLMGNEQRGLEKDLLAACTDTVALPMRGRASSLNLAVATGVVLYGILARQG